MQNPCARQGYRDYLSTRRHQVVGTFAPVTTEARLPGIRCVCTFLQLELFRVKIDLFDVRFDKPQEFIEVT
ncbi:hypothetical protein DPD11_07135 [Salmonella enterica subsp. salamae]|nr:hypothetical protein [Salmonella enterica subsp. salamae]